MMNRMLRVVFAAMLLLGLAACDPHDRRPGLWLTGDVAQSFPEDWSFVDGVPEIALEVHTPYFLPHSITIWCVEVNGRLYVAAGNAADKHWPGWVDDDSNVRLKIGDAVYEAQLAELTDAAEIRPVQQAYARKYHLQGSGSGDSGGTRYWRVQSRGA